MFSLLSKSAIFIVLVVLITLTFAQAAQAAYLYESTFYRMGQNYASMLGSQPNDSLSSLAPDKRRICERRYDGILNDGSLSIKLIMGYFDWTTGSSVTVGGQNYGFSPSLDIGAWAALARLMLAPCSGRLQFCGFKQDKENPYIFRKSVNIHGQAYPVRVDIHFSSASEIHNQNIGKLSERQKQRTQVAESSFLRGLQSSDAVFYFGHSRDGGGPDFRPPVFKRGLNKVDYSGYYQPQRPGLKKMVSALTAGEGQTKIIGLMSCNSRNHFVRKVRSIAPNTGVISSLDVLTVDEVFTALVGGVDSLLRGQCQSSFYRAIRLTSRNQQYITMDGMFE